VCGLSVVFLCLNYLENNYYGKYMIWAFVAFPFALFFDVIDGWVARKRYSSPFGGDLDSLADLISFGVAPATLGFTLGLRGIWDSIILTIFVLCGLSRLARYNVTAEIISEGTGKVKYYEGIPIPGSLIIVLILFVAWYTDHWGPHGIYGGQMDVYPGHFHPFSLIYLVVGMGMVSLVKIPKP
jgi:CDP-diacylglycerol--serine O-phosphatidyltransferase